MVNLRTFDLNLLRVFDALLDEPQVSLAARHLHLSQPATSAALGRLRSALGDPLLVRTGNEMIRTPMAEELRPKVRRLLAEIEQTLRAPVTFSPATSERVFRIAANDYAVAAILSPLLKRMQQLAPQVAFEIIPFEDDFDKRLAEDTYDLAIRDQWAMRSWRRLETLFTEDYVCIARRDHSRLGKTPTLDQFLSEGHVLISPRGRSPGVVDKALDRLKRTRRVTVTLPHFLAAPAVVASTDYVMTIPRRVALQFVQLYRLRLFPPPVSLRGFDVAMAWHPRSESDSGVGWLRDQVREAAHGRHQEQTAKLKGSALAR
jgi:DNA-binding transcriptional LysR family regulator